MKMWFITFSNAMEQEGERKQTGETTKENKETIAFTKYLTREERNRNSFKNGKKREGKMFFTMLAVFVRASLLYSIHLGESDICDER